MSLQDASVLSAKLSTPAPTTYADQLAYDATTGNFYTVATHTTLVRINAGTLNHVSVGSGIGAFFNFVSLAADTDGNLWLATDANGGELWTVNKLTGLGSVHTAIQLPVNYDLTGMMIDRTGDFILYVRSAVFGIPSYFCKVDPNTGTRTILADGWSDPSSFITAMAYDPVTNGYYGILTENDTWSNTLVRITGVPEPSSMALAALGLTGLVAWGWRRKRS